MIFYNNMLLWFSRNHFVNFYLQSAAFSAKTFLPFIFHSSVFHRYIIYYYYCSVIYLNFIVCLFAGLFICLYWLIIVFAVNDMPAPYGSFVIAAFDGDNKSIPVLSHFGRLGRFPFARFQPTSLSPTQTFWTLHTACQPSQHLLCGSSSRGNGWMDAGLTTAQLLLLLLQALIVSPTAPRRVNNGREILRDKDVSN